MKPLARGWDVPNQKRGGFVAHRLISERVRNLVEGQEPAWPTRACGSVRGSLGTRPTPDTGSFRDSATRRQRTPGPQRKSVPGRVQTVVRRDTQPLRKSNATMALTRC